MLDCDCVCAVAGASDCKAEFLDRFLEAVSESEQATELHRADARRLRFRSYEMKPTCVG